MLRGGWAAGDAYQWMFDEQTALFPSTYMHYSAEDSPPPLNASYLLRAIMIPKWLFLPAVFRPLRTTFPGLGAGFLNLAGQTERTAKKRGKNEQKWARYGLLKRVRAAVL